MEDRYIGTRLEGRYEVEKLVGEGGMANVYRGKDLKDGRTVAIKILREEFCDNAELVRRFHNESRAISVLNHPNIVKVYDVSATDKIQYIVMEYIRGITLKEYIEQRGEPLTYKEVVHFITQVLLALKHAHDKGIVHRDIKPQNIMILEDGNIKVMDFGIARLARSEIHTAEEQAIGSVHYISPEQAQGIDTDHRADIYSAGIMMYEMLSGRLPFEDENAVSVAIKQISDEATPLELINPSVPQGLIDITNKAMCKDPKNRYQDSLEMLRDVEEFKKDPSIKFEYDYLKDESPGNYMNKIMGGKKQGSAPKQTPAEQRKGAKNARAARAGKGATVTKNGKKKHRRRMGLLVPIVLGITLAVVGFSAIYIWDLLQNSDNPFFGSYEEIDLPNFVGRSYDEFQDITKKAPYNHLRVKVTEEYNPNEKAGKIMAQRPESSNTSPMRVKANQVVHLTVSRGVQTVEIPDISGMSRLEGIEAIRERGLIPYTKRITDDRVPVGKIVGTDPEAGTLVQNTSGTRVIIYVSHPERNYFVDVPNIVGQESLEDAQKVLDKFNLNIGNIDEVPSDLPPGTILEQYPLPATQVKIGASISVVVATGYEAPEEEPEEEDEYTPPPEDTRQEIPGVVGWSSGDAESAISSRGFGVVVETRHSDSVPSGVVIEQNAVGKADAGTVVTIVVSSGPENPGNGGDGDGDGDNNGDNNGDDGGDSEDTQNSPDALANPANGNSRRKGKNSD